MLCVYFKDGFMLKDHATFAYWMLHTEVNTDVADPLGPLLLIFFGKTNNHIKNSTKEDASEGVLVRFMLKSQNWWQNLQDPPISPYI